MAKKARMGRNLDALLGGARDKRSRAELSQAEIVETGAPGTAFVDEQCADEGGRAPIAAIETEEPTASSRQPGETLLAIAVDRIRRGGFQPRREFDQAQLEELANSLRQQGMLQPVLVRPFAGAYELIAGERRWRAAQLAGLESIPALVRELDDRSVAAVSLIENIQRQDLNPLEEANALLRLCEEFGMTHQAVAEAVGRSRAAVSNLMRMLELHDDVKRMLERGEIDMGHGRALLSAARDEQPSIARRIVDHGLTVRAVEKLVRQLKETETPNKQTVELDPDVERLSRGLGDLLGAKVRIRHKADGGGKLEIGYTSVAELEGILAHIN